MTTTVVERPDQGQRTFEGDRATKLVSRLGSGWTELRNRATLSPHGRRYNQEMGKNKPNSA